MLWLPSTPPLVLKLRAPAMYWSGRGKQVVAMYELMDVGNWLDRLLLGVAERPESRAILQGEGGGFPLPIGGGRGSGSLGAANPWAEENPGSTVCEF